MISLQQLVFLTLTSALTLPAFADTQSYIWDSTNGFETADGCDVVVQNSDDFNLAGRVLQIKSGAFNHMVGESGVTVMGSYWHQESDSQGYYTYSCGDDEQHRTYYVFDVFAAGSNDPIAQVGVSKQDQGIFQSATSLSADEAETAINAQANSPAKSQMNRFTSSKPVSLSSQHLQEKRQEKAPVKLGEIVNQAMAGAADIEASPSAEAKANGAKPQASSPSAAGKTPEAGAPNEGKKVQGEKQADATVPVIKGALEFIVCTSAKSIKVTDKKHKKTLFTVKNLDSAKPVQRFDERDRGSDQIEVQFPDEKGNSIGWIAKSAIQPPSSCPAAKAAVPAASKSGLAKSLNDANCCEFPTTKRAQVSYKEGMRQYGYPRAGGERIHAACDIYRPLGEEIVAVSPGTVVRGLSYFYESTYELEVRGPGGFIVRYGEVLGRGPKGVGLGATIKQGQVVGLVGQTTSPHPMLHFELYSGKGSGPLTVFSSPGFERRSDLLNPTDYLTKWEQMTFGQHY